MFKWITKYFDWLQKDNPTGGIDLFPELTEDGETSLKGVYIVGDLTGVPLLKFATNAGKQSVTKYITTRDKISAKKTLDKFENDPNFKTRAKKHEKDSAGLEIYDLVIIGAGPAGIAAAIEAKERGLSYIVLEASERPFNTIENFPKGKPMFYEPQGVAEESPLKLKGDTKEQLLDQLKAVLDKYDIDIRFKQKVAEINAIGGGENMVKTDDGKEYHARRTILAIGKTGNHRLLGVKGENLPHVYFKLYDPNEFKGRKVLVVGGGDTALESVMLMHKVGCDVTLSYRGKEFTRPKPDNINTINQLAEKGEIKVLFESNVTEIREGEVDIMLSDVQKTEKFDNVFLLIGNQLPYEFFEKSGIKIANAKTSMTWWWLSFSIAFMVVVYFGKWSAPLHGGQPVEALLSIFQNTFFISIVQVLAWLGIVGMILTAPVILHDLIKNWKYYFQTKWSYIKYGYFAFVLIIFLIAFLGNKYFSYDLAGQDPYFWYAFVYTTTIGLFGLRRIIVTKKKYVTYQTISVFLIQALPLFFIPNFILPWMHDLNLLHPWIVENVFLGGEWWRFVGFILAWPLFIWNIFTDQPSMFWLIVSLIQTFVIIPFLVYKWGKGAYCSWICSCGAMAETLGDEYRTLMWHGPLAKKVDNAGQVILFSIFTISILHVLGWVPSLSGTLAGLNNMLMGGYQLIVDTILAGVVGFGLYFFYSGRVWCRFFCPLAALMHVYNKFSQWHILADKKKCISCGLCTKACHMGIDVMGYAQQGKPLDDVECVNCSACVNVCPTGVLSFGKYKKVWDKGKT